MPIVERSPAQELLPPLSLVGGQAISRALVTLGLSHPPTQGVKRTAKLLCNRVYRSRTARSFISAGYFPCFSITQSSHRFVSPGNPGRFSLNCPGFPETFLLGSNCLGRNRGDIRSVHFQGNTLLLITDCFVVCDRQAVLYLYRGAEQC